MQRFWDSLVRVFAAGMVAALLLLNLLTPESAWWPTVRGLWLLCGVGVLVALYFSRRPRGTDESYGPDPGEDRSDHSDH